MDTVSIDEVIQQKNNGQREEAEKGFRLLTSAEEDADRAWYHLGLMAGEDGDDEKAIECYKAAIHANSSNFRAYNNLGLVFLKKEYNKEAYRCFENAHQIVPDDMLPLCNMGMAAFGMRDYKTALENYNEVKNMRRFHTIPMEPRQELLIMRGDCCLQLGQIDEAYLQYEEVSREVSNSQSRAFNQLAFIALELRKDPETANHWINQSLTLAPDFKPALQNKGLVLFKQGKYEEAVTFMQRVIDLEPDNFEGYYNIACVYCAMQEEDAARKAITKVLQLNPKVKNHMLHDQDFAIYVQTDWFKKLVK